MPLKRCGSVSARFSVWFSRRSAAANASQVGVEHLEAAGIVRASASRPCTTCSDARRFDARLGQDQRAVLEVERQQADLAGHLGARRLPAEAAGDHQVDDEEELALELERPCACRVRSSAHDAAGPLPPRAAARPSAAGTASPAGWLESAGRRRAAPSACR